MIRPSDEELYSLFERSPVGMYIATIAGDVRYANPALGGLLGYSPRELLKLNLRTDVPADANGVIDGATVRWRHRDGRLLTLKVYGKITGEPDARMIEASVLDVTASDQQRENLESTAATLDVVVAQVRAVWWLADHELRVVREGGRLENLGIVNDHVKRTLPEIEQLTGYSMKLAIDAHRRAFAGEIVRYTSGFGERILENTIAPFHDGGEIKYVIGTSVDVTMARAYEQRMIDAQRAESIGVLAGGLAHDFNNLLVAILGNADLGLRDVKPGAPGRSSLENVRQAGLRAAELVNQLLAYAGHGSVSKERVAPAPIVEELLRISAPQMPSNISVRVDLPVHLALRGDSSAFGQVVMNLITNARDALGDTGGTIWIGGMLDAFDGKVHEGDVLTPSAGSYVVIEVSDDGPGMSLETRRKAFDPFFTTKTTGHGLGLAAVLGIVRAHGGGLRLHSMPGGGTTIQIAWPATSTPFAQTSVSPPARVILVIDDEDMVRDVLGRMLEDLGYGALTASDGPSGLAIADAEKLDAVLVDLTMPRMSGAEVVAALRKTQPTLPIILCTGFDRSGHGPVAADAYLPKPFRMEALEQILEKLVPLPK
ncbi:MAG TPA: ATP-binding protein [Kofleriaceae bacterium]